MYSYETYYYDESRSCKDPACKKSTKAHLCQAKRGSSIMEISADARPLSLELCEKCGGEGCGDDFEHIPDVPPTPFWKGRWVKTFFIYLGLLMSASAYSNWQPLYLILNRMGGMTWICDEDSSHEATFAACDEQYNALTQMYTVSVNMAYVIGLVAGIMMDVIGARITMAIGAACVVVGWIMLIVSSESLQLYWPGLLLLGCAENLLGFPGFSPGKWFPAFKDTCASLCIAMQMLSSWVPILIWMLIENKEAVEDIAKNALEYYLVIIAVPLLLMIVMSPGKNSATPTSKHQKQIPKPIICPKDLIKAEQPSKLSVAHWRDVIHIVTSFDFLLFCVWYIALTLGFSFYNTKVMIHSGQEVGELIGILNPFRAAIGPVMGMLSDYVGVFPMLILDNVMIAAAFGLSLFSAGTTTSAYIYIFGRSFCFTTKYIFVQNFYPAEHFGKLCGILSFLGGSFGFLNSWFVVIDVSTQTSFMVSGILMAIIITIPVHFFIQDLRKKRNNKNIEEKAELEITSSAVLQEIA